MRGVSRPEGVFKGRFSPRRPIRDPLAGMPPIHLKKRGFYCVTAPVKYLKHVPLAMVITCRLSVRLLPIFYVTSSVSAKNVFAIFLFLQPVFLNILQVFVKQHNFQTRPPAKTSKIVSDIVSDICPTLE